MCHFGASREEIESKDECEEREQSDLEGLCMAG